MDSRYMYTAREDRWGPEPPMWIRRVRADDEAVYLRIDENAWAREDRPEVDGVILGDFEIALPLRLRWDQLFARHAIVIAYREYEARDFPGDGSAEQCLSGLEEATLDAVYDLGRIEREVASSGDRDADARLAVIDAAIHRMDTAARRLRDDSADLRMHVGQTTRERWERDVAALQARLESEYRTVAEP